MNALTQKSEAGKTTGSFFNYLMGNNQSIPVIGNGATLLLWSDRHAYEVIEVSLNGMECKLQRYDAKRLDKSGMSDCQEYSYDGFTNEVITLVYRQGVWRNKISTITFTKEFRESSNKFAIALNLTPEQRQDIYQGEAYPQKVVEGITKQKFTYSPVNVLFGKKEEYYDFTF